MKIKKQYTSEELREMTRQIRRDVVKMLMISKSGHSGGPLGLAEVFTCLYFDILNIDPEKPRWEERDYLFVSAGHLCPVWYAALARRGYIPMQELATLRKINGRLQGHPAPAHTHGVPGIELASGALGQGLSVAVGCAIGLRLSGRPNQVYALLGDGELDEGQIWEAVMTGAHHKTDNLIAIVDRNHCQIDNRTENVMALEPLAEKWKSFNWDVLECDGNDIDDFTSTVRKARQLRGKPKVIIARTYMGRGVSFMEDDYRWHGVPPSEEQGRQALRELHPTKFGDFITFEWENEEAPVIKQDASK